MLGKNDKKPKSHQAKNPVDTQINKLIAEAKRPVSISN